MLAGFPLITLVKLRFLFPFVVAYVAMQWGVTLINSVISVVIASGWFFVFVVPTMAHLSLLSGMVAAPHPWPERPTSDTRHLSPAPSLGSFLVSFPLPTALVVNLGVLLLMWNAGYIGQHLSSWHTFFGVLVIALASAIFRIGFAIVRANMAYKRKIGFFWRFNEETGWTLKNYLVPSFAAYGEVTALEDDNRRVYTDSRALEEDFTPRTDATIIHSTADWQEKVRQLIASADLIFVDVTNLSYWIAWELSECSKAAHRPIVILIAETETLHARYNLVEDVRSALGEHLPPEEVELALQIQRPPLPYSCDASLIIFKWRLFCRLRRMA